MPSDAYIHAIRTAVPYHRIPQEDILRFMKDREDLNGDERSFLDKIYTGSAIDTRHSILDDFSSDPEHTSGRSLFPGGNDAAVAGTAERNSCFTQAATEGAIALARELFALRPAGQGEQLGDSTFQAGPGNGSINPSIGPGDITHLITVSCTGFSAPGFEIDVQQALGMSEHLERLHVGFMGCYASFPALRTARSICLSDPEARVLILGVEFCTVHFQDHRDRDTMVANSLFADGLSAVLVSGSPVDSRRGRRGAPIFRIDAAAPRMVGGGDKMMAWTLGDTGFLMKLSAYVPRLIESNIEEIIARLASQAGIDSGNVSHWAIHPGGRAILDRVKDRLKLNPADMRESYEVLSRYGNMSAVTVNFVMASLSARLDDEDAGLIAPDASSAAARGSRKDRKVFAAAFGPGLTVESAILSPIPVRTGGARKQKLRYGVMSHNLPRLWPDTAERATLVELMDHPDVDESALHRTVVHFRRINSMLAGYRKLLTREVFRPIRRMEADRRRSADPAVAGEPWRIVDLGCGGGDIIRWIALEARRRNVKVEIIGVDPDERMVEWAAENTAEFDNVYCLKGSSSDLDGLKERFGAFDFIISNHVMHHLYGEELDGFIAAASRHARHGLVLNDLQRSRLAYLAYTLYAKIFACGSLAMYDGKLSILRSFRKRELEHVLGRLSASVSHGDGAAASGGRRAVKNGSRHPLAERYGAAGMKVRRVFPFRLVITRG